MNDYPRFKDFADEDERGGLEGEKVSIKDILDKEILITAFQFRQSHYYGGDYMILQFQNGNGLQVVFTATEVVKKQLERHKDQLPFYGTIIKKNRYYTLS